MDYLALVEKFQDIAKVKFIAILKLIRMKTECSLPKCDEVQARKRRIATDKSRDIIRQLALISQPLDSDPV